MTESGKLKSAAWSLLRIAAATAAILLIIGCCCVDSVIFPAPRSSYVDDGRMLKLESGPGVTVSALSVPCPKAKYAILYSHGNAEDIGQLQDVFALYVQHGYAVFAYDYRGYGTSQGKPSEEGCCRDIQAAYEYLTGTLKVPPERVILYGRSVGSGPAVWLASREKVAGLVVESGFKSTFRVVTNYGILPFDRFPNIDRMPELKCPVLFLHGTKDEVIPFSHGLSLYEAAKEPKSKLWVEGAGHNNLLYVAGDSYWQALDSFAKGLELSETK